MFDDDDSVAALDEAIHDFDEVGNVGHVQTRSWFVQDIDAALFVEFTGEFDALTFSTGKGAQRCSPSLRRRTSSSGPSRLSRMSRLVRGRWGGDRASGRSARLPAGQRGGLLHPRRHLRLVELVVFIDVDIARVLALAGAGRDRSQRRAAEKGHLDVVREDVEPQEPALALDAVQRRVPLHGLAHVGHVPHDERVEPAPDVPLPARHPGDVRLHRGVAVGLRDLRIAA